MVRYADDVLVTFGAMGEAMHFHERLIEHLDAYGLAINADKTRIIPCGSKVARHYAKVGKKMPTLSFLGFLHVGGSL